MQLNPAFGNARPYHRLAIANINLFFIRASFTPMRGTKRHCEEESISKQVGGVDNVEGGEVVCGVVRQGHRVSGVDDVGCGEVGHGVVRQGPARGNGYTAKVVVSGTGGEVYYRGM